MKIFNMDAARFTLRFRLAELFSTRKTSVVTADSSWGLGYVVKYEVFSTEPGDFCVEKKIVFNQGADEEFLKSFRYTSKLVQEMWKDVLDSIEVDEANLRHKAVIRKLSKFSY